MEEVRATPDPTLCAKLLGGRADMDLEELCRERGIAVDGGLICVESIISSYPDSDTLQPLNMFVSS